jgi:hypothetical protein
MASITAIGIGEELSDIVGLTGMEVRWASERRDEKTIQCGRGSDLQFMHASREQPFPIEDR